MLWFLRKPSNDRDWSPENAVLPRIEVDGAGVVRVSGVRCFRYRSTRDYDPGWEEREYRLDTLDRLDFLVAPFSMFKSFRSDGGKAHTFVSFGFGDEQLAVSIEVRRIKGQRYDPIRGMFRGYEIIYVFGDERDIVGVRTAHTSGPVYLFNVRTAPEHMRSMFLGMAERANALREQPEFYNTITNTCTTNLVRHVNAVAPRRIPTTHASLLPGYSAWLLYRLGLIDTDRPYSDVLARARIDAAAGKAIDEPDFSRRIRR